MSIEPTLTVPLAHLAGEERDPDAGCAAELHDGSRVLEVARFRGGELLELRHLAPPGRASKWAALLGGALLTLGLLLLDAATIASVSALLAGGISLALASVLRPRPELAEGWSPRLRWRRRSVELSPPEDAEGELELVRGATSLVSRLGGGRAPRSIAIPVDARVRLRLGALELRLAWARPVRRLPRAARRLRWGIGSALGLSLLAHFVLVGMAQAVPEAVSLGEPLDLEPRFIRTSRIPPEPDQEKLDHWLNALVGDRLHTRHSRPLVSEPPRWLWPAGCRDHSGAAQVLLGHLTVSGMRPRRFLERELARELRRGELVSCYRTVLRRERCAGAARLVLQLTIDPQGVVALERVSPLDEGSLGECVSRAVGRWRLLPDLSQRRATLVRLPLIFRYPGADSYEVGWSGP